MPNNDGAPAPENRAVFQAGANALTQARRGRTNNNLTVHRYPSDVGSAQHPHYAMFYISKRRSDIGTGTPEAGGGLRIDTSRQNNPANKTLSPGALGTIMTVSAAFGGAALADSLSQVLPGPVEGAAKTGLVIGGGALGASAAKDSKITSARDKVLLKDVVALYVNDKPSVSYKANWQDADIGIVAGMSDIFKSGGGLANAGKQMLAGDFSGALDSAKAALGSALNTAKGAAGAFAMKNAPNLGGLGDVSALMSSTTGTAVNPFTAQLFKSMGFRTFSFNYSFLPRNPSEYEEAQAIVRLFKKYMHPTMGPNAYIMGYPAEFSIAYYYKDAENDHLFKISSCALTDMKVEYGGQDFITFRGTDGAPAEISLQLQFTELELLTQQRVEDGY